MEISLSSGVKALVSTVPSPVEIARTLLVQANNRLPDALQVVESGTLRGLSSKVIAIVFAVLVVSSASVVAVPLMDADGDGLRNATEWSPQNEGDWQARDTDGDGIHDNIEVYSSDYDVADPDTDSDGVNDSQERQRGLNASRPDTDRDGLLDEVEIEGITDPTSGDTDGDGLNDGQERELGSSPVIPDTDWDNVSDGQEYQHNTSLTSRDTDSDNLSDYQEISSNRLNPRKADTDSDGLSDHREVNMETYANISDSDDDELRDGAELANETAPTVPDSDDDGLLDGAEVIDHGSDPLNPDTDFDNLTDHKEVEHRLLNATNDDVDGDRLKDGVEWYGTTNVSMADTDADGLGDWNETKNLETDPADNDSDSDQLLDGNETLHFDTDETDPDTDGDQLEDGPEMHQYETNPVNPDTDGDSLSDFEEIHEYGTDPTVKDTDGDNVSDSLEIRVHQTNATNPDSDADGIPDDTEIAVQNYDPLEPNPLKSNESDLVLSRTQKDQLNESIAMFTEFSESVAKDDPDAGIIREYSQAIAELPAADFTGPNATVVNNFKQAGLYQVLDIIESDLGLSTSSRALEGRLTQAIKTGSRLNPVLALISDYSALHTQAEKLVNATGQNATAAKIGVIIATTILVVDAYLLSQTGGTATLASAQRVFSLTGKVAAKTKLARLASSCGWKCVGGIERLIHWSLRTLIEIGETQLLGTLIGIGTVEVNGITLGDIAKGIPLDKVAQLRDLPIANLSDFIRRAIQNLIQQILPQLNQLHRIDRATNPAL